MFGPISTSKISPGAISAAVCSFFAGRGDTRTVIWINAIGCLVTALLDYCWIFGHENQRLTQLVVTRAVQRAKP